MRRVIGYLREFAGRMTVGFIIKTLGTIVELFLPLILLGYEYITPGDSRCHLIQSK